MAIEQYEHILARLYTEQKFRSDFFNASNRSLLNASEEIKKLLDNIKQDEVEFFALGLLNKRWGVIKGLLSITNKFQKQLYEHFVAYAENTPLYGLHYKHYNDALNFSEYLLRTTNLSPFLKDCIRFERLLIKSNLNSNLFLSCFLNYDFREINQTQSSEVLPRKKLALILMFRYSRKSKWRVCHF